MEYVIVSNFNEEKNCWEVSLAGEIDIYSSSNFKIAMHDLLGKKLADVYIDCKELDYIDSTGLGALVSIVKFQKTNNNNVHLINLKPSVLRLFKLTDLDRVFIIEGE